MPNVRSLIGAQGATFGARLHPLSPLLPVAREPPDGEYMHNHLSAATSGRTADGTVPPQEANALPVWTKDAGYYNLHIGKYMNGYAESGDAVPVPTAWDEWYGKISEGPLYFNYQLIEQTAPGDTPELEFYGDQAGEYQTDVLGDKAVDFADGLTAFQTPF